MTDYAEPLLKIKAAIKELEKDLPAGKFVKAEMCVIGIKIDADLLHKEILKKVAKQTA